MREISTKFYFEKSKGREHLAEPGIGRETGCEYNEWLCSVELIGCLFFTVCYVGLLSFEKVIESR